MFNLQIASKVVEKIIKLADWDGSGDIDAREIKPLLSELELPVTDSQVASVMAKFDVSGDDKLDLPELARRRQEPPALQPLTPPRLHAQRVLNLRGDGAVGEGEPQLREREGARGDRRLDVRRAQLDVDVGGLAREHAHHLLHPRRPALGRGRDEHVPRAHAVGQPPQPPLLRLEALEEAPPQKLRHRALLEHEHAALGARAAAHHATVLESPCAASGANLMS